MAKYEIVELPKTLTRVEARRALANERPGLRIEALELRENAWIGRLIEPDRISTSKRDLTAAPKDDSSDEDVVEVEDSPDDSADDGEKPKGDSGSKVKPEGAALVNKIQDLLKELEHLTADLEGTASDLGKKHDEKQDTLEKVKDLAEQSSEPPMPPPDLENKGGPVGPVPGVGGPRGPKMPPRKMPFPTGVPTFTNNQSRHHVLTHSGKNESGEKVDLAGAFEMLNAQVESEYPNYEVVGINPSNNGGYVAKLKLRDAETE
jgi:hypothetical protein